MEVIETIKIALPVFAQHKSSDWEVLGQSLERAGIASALADKLLEFMPLAFGRVFLDGTGIRFADHFIRYDPETKCRQVLLWEPEGAIDMNNSQQTNSALGALESEHLRAKKFAALAIVGIVFTLLLACGVIALILFVPSSGKTSDMNAAYGMVGLSLVFCGFCVWALLRQKDVSVKIFENGLTYTRGTESKIFRWDEIESLWTKIIDNYVNGVRVRTTAYTLQRSNGEKVILFHAIENIERIGERVSAEVFRRIYPRDLQTIKNGGSVAFGKFTITPKGIQKGEDFIGWQEIKNVETKDGKICVENQNGKIRTSVLYSNLPNAQVFLALAAQLKREN
ncbi:MAG: DUF6585 family protein [Pyrinomonadaceae bacterium]